MAQVLEFKLPDLGEGLTEAEIVRWLVRVGDVVAVDQPVVEVETAKAMVEVPCPYGGVVTARYGEEGTELPVGAPLLTVAVGPRTPEAEAEAGGSGNVLVGYGTSEAPTRRRRVRPAPVTAGPAGARAGTPTAPEYRPANGSTAAAGTGGTAARDAGAAFAGTVLARESAPLAEGPVPVISPLVRKLARDNDLDLRVLTGSGPDGLILRVDVETVLRARTVQDGRTAGAATLPAATGVTTGPAPAPSAPVSPAPSHRPGTPRASVSPSRASAAPSRTSSRAAAARSRTRPAGSTPTPPNSCARGPP